MNSPGSVLKGIALTVGLHVAAAVLSVVGSTAAGVASVFILGPMLAIGIVQWVYLVPIAIMLKRRGETQTMKGVLIAGGITVMLNVACTGIVLGSLGNMH